MTNIFSRLLALALITQSNGCSLETCTSMPCNSQLSLPFSGPLEEPGVYTIEVSSAGNTMSCQVSIPANVEEECGMVQREEITTVDGDSVHGRRGDSLVGLVLNGDYEALSVTIVREGTPVADVQIQPEYKDVEVNGEGCGGCPRAEHEISVETSNN